MTSVNFPVAGLLKVDRKKPTNWAPILCHPREASQETFVVGIVAITEGEFHIEPANKLSRLACLYADDAKPLVLGIQMAIEWLESTLADIPPSKLSAVEFPVSNITLGECRQAFGLGCKSIASHWMATLSSFYDKTTVSQNAEISLLSDSIREIEQRSRRLPVQVLGFIEQRNAKLLAYFHEDVRKKSLRRVRANARVKIDYDGIKLSANIDRFDVDSPSQTVGKLKQQMWDLAIQREKSSAAQLPAKNYELLVDLSPYEFIDKREASVERIKDHIGELTRQADREEIRFRSLDGPTQIGEHILAREAA